MIISKIISTEIGAMVRRVIKVLVNGRDDVRTGREVAPYGIDANPVPGVFAVYSPTAVKGKAVIIGYMNVNQMAEVGEVRLYSTDSNGALKMYVWLKNDGTLELGGNSGNATRFQQLEQGFNQLRDDHNNLVNAFNSHMHPTAGTGAPSPPTPGSGIPASPSNADISGAKIEEIKTL